MGKLSEPFTTMSKGSMIRRAFSDESGSLKPTTSTLGLMSRSRSAPDSTLGAPDVLVPVQDLAVQIGHIDGVEVDEPHPADAGRRQVERGL